MPEHLTRYCSTFYSRSSTRLVLGNDQLSERIISRIGIKQDDPLSVHLFNAVIDLCTSKLNPNIGYTFNEKVSFLAFADDLVLLADSSEGLDVNCRKGMEELSLAGFKANAEKSATLNIKALRGKWVCDPREFLKIEGEQVPPISIVGSYKYLGLPILAELTPANLADKLTSWLQRLSSAPLKTVPAVSLPNPEAVSSANVVEIIWKTTATA